MYFDEKKNKKDKKKSKEGGVSSNIIWPTIVNYNCLQ